MKIETIKRLFLNKKVKLVKDDGFVLYGKITSTDGDSVVFETETATSLINLSRIDEICPMEN